MAKMTPTSKTPRTIVGLAPAALIIATLVVGLSTASDAWTGFMLVLLMVAGAVAAVYSSIHLDDILYKVLTSLGGVLVTVGAFSWIDLPPTAINIFGLTLILGAAATGGALIFAEKR
ncbi:hypothetical protein KRX51_07410 [Corynebacterium sp. TAE3-ERU12]|uniref:hypothetical protein n=1 Tax=Corynebacterium sp. TAE3-ERU12 TaxID=2849491 RepID=UPI001C45F597|nr:hypothetical protein [Corynebacterium sp. TAE3-ERU12]MBV7295740.1 hypothetical protein [Corynebacterium sp. TAE3-ERU12]